MAKTFNVFHKGIRLKGETSNPTDNIEGSLWLNATDDRLRGYVEAAVRELLTADQIQTVSNKSIDADNNTITNIDNDEIKAAAAIALDKLAPLSGSIVPTTDASGFLVDSTVTSTELGYLSGVTSSIQTQIDDNASDITTKANTTLDNLGSTAVNADISPAPASTETLNLGSASAVWSNVYTNQLDIYSGGSSIGVIDFSGINLRIATAGTPSADINLQPDGAVVIGGSGNLIVNGNLTVNGSNTTINSTVLQVDDPQIEVNVGGSQLTATGNVSGIRVTMTDATDAIMGYSSTSATKFTVGEAGFPDDVVGRTATQTLTNKTIDFASNTLTGVASTALDNLSSVAINTALLPDAASTIDLGSTTNPFRHLYIGEIFDNTGVKVLDFDNTSGLIVTDASISPNSLTQDMGLPTVRWQNVYTDSVSSGAGATLNVQAATELDLNAGTHIDANSNQIKNVANPTDAQDAVTLDYFDTNVPTGSGGINLEDQPFAQGGLNSWSEYDDGANVDIVDATGGTAANLTLTAEPAATTILTGDYTGVYRMAYSAADAQGEGVSKDYALPQRFQDAGYCFVRLSYAASAALATGDMKLQFYDVTNSSVLTSYGLVDDEIPGVSAGSTGQVVVRVPLASNTATLRVALHRAVTTATAFDFDFSDVQVTLDKTVDSPIFSYLGELSTTGSWTTNTTYTGKYWRENDILVGDVYIDLTGTPPSVALDLDLPSGYTVDTAKTHGGSFSYQGQGFVRCRPGSSGDVYSGTINGFGTSNVRITFLNTNAASTSNAEPLAINSIFTSTTALGTFGSGGFVHVQYRVPIAEWANQTATLSTTEMLNETAVLIATQSADQTIPNATGTTINWGTVKKQRGNAVTVSPSGIITFNEVGTYFVSSTVHMIGLTQGSGETRHYGIGVLAGLLEDRGGIENSETTRGSSCIVDISSSGATGAIEFFQSNGASRDTEAIHCLLSIAKIPDFSVYSVYGKFEIVSAESATLTPTGNGYQALVGNGITLSPGTWELLPSQCVFSSSGGNPSYGRVFGNWSSNQSTFSNVQNAPEVTLLSETVISGRAGLQAAAGFRELICVTSSVIISVNSQVTIYLMPYLEATNHSFSRVSTVPTARRLQ